jgi:hypothetical protein
MNASLTRSVRNLADARSAEMNQHGIRMLRNYHSLIRSHALLHRRTDVTSEDLEFLRCVDRHVSITECRQLDFDGR